MNDLIKNALELAACIFNTRFPDGKPYLILNIAKSDHIGTVSFNSHPNIKDIYTYLYDQVSEYFEQEGIIEAKFQNHYFTGVGNKVSEGIVYHDPITKYARKKGYFTNKEFSTYDPDHSWHPTPN